MAGGISLGSRLGLLSAAGAGLWGMYKTNIVPTVANVAEGVFGEGIEQVMDPEGLTEPGFVMELVDRTLKNLDRGYWKPMMDAMERHTNTLARGIDLGVSVAQAVPEGLIKAGLQYAAGDRLAAFIQAIRPFLPLTGYPEVVADAGMLLLGIRDYYNANRGRVAMPPGTPNSRRQWDHENEQRGKLQSRAYHRIANGIFGATETSHLFGRTGNLLTAVVGTGAAAQPELVKALAKKMTEVTKKAATFLKEQRFEVEYSDLGNFTPSLNMLARAAAAQPDVNPGLAWAKATEQDLDSALSGLQRAVGGIRQAFDWVMERGEESDQQNQATPQRQVLSPVRQSGRPPVPKQPVATRRK